MADVTIGDMIQVCLNGRRGADASAAVPLSPEALARSAAEAVAAGATDIHVHPRTPCGQDTLSPPVVAATLTAIRAAVRVPVGVTTGAWAEPDPRRRVERVREWSVLPDHASVNWHEPGADELAAALLERGVGVEAGLWSGTEGHRLFLRSSLGPRVLRVLAEVTDTDPATATGSARLLLAEVGTAHGRPVLLHGGGRRRVAGGGAGLPARPGGTDRRGGRDGAAGRPPRALERGTGRRGGAVTADEHGLTHEHGPIQAEGLRLSPAPPPPGPACARASGASR